MIDPDLLKKLRCPHSGASLMLSDNYLVSSDSHSRYRYKIENGIPVLLKDEATLLVNSEWNELMNHVKDENMMEIREDFKRKSSTYYQRNYLSGQNKDRHYRQELVKSEMQKLNVSNCDVLDAGAGPGVLGEIVMECSGNYFASDLSFYNIEASRNRLGPFPGIVADTCALPFADHSFDFVFSIGSIEYIADQQKAISEICRVVKHSGAVVFTLASSGSPANWVNDRIYFPFKKIKRSRTNNPVYKRYFTGIREVRWMLHQANFEISHQVFFTPGIFDNQLKKIKLLSKLERKLVSIFPFLQRAGKEILIVARPAK